ncbi:MAG: hypothetical protein P8R39_03825 [Alphaproteobacteria bacterium]|nr:hypothetical protein [Alphaproteobacteria bacterium]
MSVTINGSGTITSSTGTLGFDDENITTTGNLTGTLTSLPAISGANLTTLNASNLASGTVPAARLGTGTASSSTILYGNNTWGSAPSAGLTLLATGTASDSATLEFTSVMTSDYLTYLFVFQSLQPASASAVWRASLSDDNGSSYSITHRYITPATYYAGTSGTSGNSGNSESAAPASEWYLTNGVTHNDDGGLSAQLWVYDALTNGAETRAHGTFLSKTNNAGNRLGATPFYGSSEEATVHNAIKFRASNGNITSGKILCYGLKT